MGDGNSIPRSFSGKIGVADVTAAVNRHHFSIPLVAPLGNTTTGIMFGCNSATTGVPFLQRNATLEKLYLTTFKNTTVNGKTTVLAVHMFKNGASTIFNLTLSNSTTIGERYMAGNTAPAIANLVATDRISLNITTRNMASKVTAVLVFRERTDS